MLSSDLPNCLITGQKFELNKYKICIHCQVLFSIYNLYNYVLDMKIPFFFQIIFVGKVGRNNLGDLALDDVSLGPGSCPSNI